MCQHEFIEKLLGSFEGCFKDDVEEGMDDQILSEEHYLKSEATQVFITSKEMVLITPTGLEGTLGDIKEKTPSISSIDSLVTPVVQISSSDAAVTQRAKRLEDLASEFWKPIPVLSPTMPALQPASSQVVPMAIRHTSPTPQPFSIPILSRPMAHVEISNDSPMAPALYIHQNAIVHDFSPILTVPRTAMPAAPMILAMQETHLAKPTCQVTHFATTPAFPVLVQAHSNAPVLNASPSTDRKRRNSDPSTSPAEKRKRRKETNKKSSFTYRQRRKQMDAVKDEKIEKLEKEVHDLKAENGMFKQLLARMNVYYHS